jgi:exosortase/archaeosortase family protein
VGYKKRKHKYSEKEIKYIHKKEFLTSMLPLLKAFGLWAVLVAIVAWDYIKLKWISMVFVHFTTYLTYGLSKVLFIPAKLLGHGALTVGAFKCDYDSIMISSYPMTIELECSAYHAYLAMVALVIFANWGLKNKIIWGSIIFGILAMVNSFRIVLLGVIGHKFPSLFDLIHDYAWNILMVVILWGLYEFVNTRLTKNEQKN